MTLPLVSRNDSRTVMVDLRGLEPSGINGGLQTYIEWLIPWIVANHREKFIFLALARENNLALVSSLLGEEDFVCVESPDDQIILRGSDGAPTMASVSLPPAALSRSLNIDVLYAPLGPLPFANLGSHSIALVADMLHRELPETLTPEIVAHRERYISFTVQNASLIQCISRSAQERLEHHYPEARGKTFYAYLPIQSRLMHAMVHQSGAAVFSTPYFLYPANFWPHKNHRVLLLAYYHYVHGAGDAAWDLILCGSDYGGGAGEIQDLTQALGLEKKVHFPGYVDDATLASLWQQASALIFPSLHEGFGIPLLEAMAMELPVLTSPCYSMCEVAGEAALYFNPRKPLQIASQMLEVGSNELLRKKLVHLGRERLKKFDSVKEASLLVQALRGGLPVREKSELMPVCGCPR